MHVLATAARALGFRDVSHLVTAAAILGLVAFAVLAGASLFVIAHSAAAGAHAGLRLGAGAAVPHLRRLALALAVLVASLAAVITSLDSLEITDL